jgi:hypothetical protein
VLELAGRRTYDDPRRSISLRMEWLLRRAETRPDREIRAVEDYQDHEDGAFTLAR